MLDKIYNFTKLEFTTQVNYKSSAPLIVFAECGVEYNKTISIASPIIKFEFKNEEDEIVCFAKFKSTIALIHVTNGNLESIKKEVMVELFQFMHAMAIGYFTNYNETQTSENNKIFLQPINYNDLVTNDLNLK